MADFGVDPTAGFVLKKFNDIKTDLEALLNQVKDPETGEFLQVDFDEDDPLINIMNSFIDSMSDAWEVIEAAYKQFDPLLATGPSHSGLVQLNGITRKAGTVSTVNITVFGTIGLIIPAGQQFNDPNIPEVVWQTDADITISGSGDEVGTASTVDPGTFNASALTLTQILTPFSGWDAISNQDPSVPGTFDETDEELRVRRERSTLTPSITIAETIQSNVLNLDGVTHSRLFVNNTLVIDGDGIPAKTVALVVLGGENDLIASELFTRVGLAVETFGTTTVNITDPFGEIHPIKFIRPTEVQMKIDLNISIIDVNLFGTESEQEIKDAIIAYAQDGALGIGINPGTQGFDPFGFPPGEDVLISRLYTPINSIAGHNVNSLQIAKLADSLGVIDVPIDPFEVAAFLDANITITVV